MRTRLKFNRKKTSHEIIERCKLLFHGIQSLELSERIETINSIRSELKEYSPFKDEPVDCVIWEKNEIVKGNEYNPNQVAPPEMELLRVSINNDGYTQPIVSYKQDDEYEVVDGFHRSRVGKECKDVNERVMGYLPLVVIKKSQSGINDRMASTIRHNRARGKHKVDSMSEIILELKNRNWKNSRIAKELGMDEEEILRLCQVTGLEGLFSDDDFSKSWIASDSTENVWEELTDELDNEGEEEYRTVNTSDPDRIFHTFDKWECNKAGLYNTKVDDKNKKECEAEYYNVLTDEKLFSKTLEKIIIEWKNSCEHYLTNTAMNRLSWLGQAAVCYSKKIPCKYCSGWNLLSIEEQNIANDIALKYLNKWFVNNGREEISLEDALSIGRQVNIY